MRVCAVGMLLLLLCVPLGCSSSNPTNPEPIEDCTGSVSISVTGGTTPRFSWTPRCRLFFLNVEPADAGTDQWTVLSDSANLIAPPVVYGIVPAGAQELTSPEQLIAGQEYKVVLGRFTGPGPQDGELIGIQIFTP